MVAKSFPEWLRQQVRAEVREATRPAPSGSKTAPSAPKEATGKPGGAREAPKVPQTRQKPVQRPAKPARVPPGHRTPVRVDVAPVPEPPGVFRPPPLKPPATDAHQVDGPCPCRICGGPVAPGPCRYFGPWRQHDGCERLAGDPAARIAAAVAGLGIGQVEHADAGLLRITVARFDQVHAEPTWDQEPMRDRMPWRHVNRKSLVRALAALPDLRADAGWDPTECTDGRCAWCGVVTATGWAGVGLTWADGSPAPLCGDCHRLYIRYGEPTHPDEVRAALAEAITSVPVMSGEEPPSGLVPYLATTPGEDPGPEFRWAHLNPEAVAAYRWQQWGRWGGQYAPPEHRAEAVRRAAEAERAAAQANAEKAREEAERRNVFGF
jgi:hypothetical protein